VHRSTARTGAFRLRWVRAAMSDELSELAQC
jgi:hypothetical protein